MSTNNLRPGNMFVKEFLFFEGLQGYDLRLDEIVKLVQRKPLRFLWMK